MIKKTKSIDKWCPHFSELGSVLKTKAKEHLDCTDCGLNGCDCPYEDENYNKSDPTNAAEPQTKTE